MRLGILEIIIIIVVIVAVAVIARIIRTGGIAIRHDKKSSTDDPGRQVREKSNGKRSFLKRAGVALIVTGGILLSAGATLFRWALQSYWWSFLLVAVGLVLVYFARKK